LLLLMRLFIDSRSFLRRAWNRRVREFSVGRAIPTNLSLPHVQRESLQIVVACAQNDITIFAG
jgi:hypothetical protein